MLIIANSVLAGRFNLSHHTIACPFQFLNCEFLGPVDLRYADFLHNVRFTGCTFRDDFNSGDRLQSHTCYRKDFHIDGCTFMAGAHFNGCNFDGSFYLHATSFKSKVEEVEFTAAVFKKALDCENTTFWGPVAFNNIECGMLISFEKAAFLSTDGEVDFIGATCAKNLQIISSVFFGPVKFTRVNCEISGYFGGCMFLNPDSYVKFDRSDFGTLLTCERSMFWGEVSFRGVKTDTLKLTSARFENSTAKVVLSSSIVEGNLDCKEAVFRGPVQINGIRCKGDALFQSARFGCGEEVQIKFASIDVSLDFSGAIFRGPLNLDASRIRGTLDLRNVILHQHLVLRNASVQRVSVTGIHVEKPGSLDLRGFKFETFDGSRAMARLTVNSQATEFFSRDPYIQLERYYSRIGDEVESRNIYYLGHCKLSENAQHPKGTIQWTRSRRCGNWIIKALTGYGVRSERLLIPIVGLLLLGAMLFGGDTALRRVSTDPRVTAGGVLRQDSIGVLHRTYYRTGYSFDLFLPVVDLGLATRWEPTTPRLQAYAGFHALVGWLLVPLLIASLSGVVKKRGTESDT